MDNDYQLLRRIREGDEGALSLLMEKYKHAIFHFAFRYTGNEADAAELAEETFVRVYFKADRFRPKAKLKTWIFTIAANLCRDFLRRKKKHAGTISLDANRSDAESLSLKEIIPGNEPDPATKAGSRESLAEIEAAIQALPYKLKFPFIFCVLEQHSYGECADVLKTSRKTVENRIYRARLLLRGKLQGTFSI